MRGLVVAALLVAARVASAATVNGLVFDDANGDGLPSPGESGIAGAVVSRDGRVFATTDGTGHYALDASGAGAGIVWVRVPAGFRPGPVWARIDPAHDRDLDLALVRLPARAPAPTSFVVASDTHIAYPDQFVMAADLATAATGASALEPEPAFFTVLGDITQGNRPEEFALVDAALGGLGVPFIPVPGNHDWWDGGEAWFAHYGPDNYSFDIGTTHFVVWNMMMGDDAIRAYLGAELAHVDPAMTIIALTHAPPSDSVVDVLRDLGVDYVLTGHAHSNRVVDHDGLIELNTEPFLMGGLDFTPAGYRVMTIDGGRLASYHRTTVDEPLVRVAWPRADACMPARGGQLVVAVEVDGASPHVAAQLDCATPVALRPAGGLDYAVELPALAPGPHVVRVTATSPSGTRGEVTRSFTVCASPPVPVDGDAWSQLGGDAAHLGTRAREIAPPLVARWTTALGGHVVTAPPVIERGVAYVAVSDLGDGTASFVVAVDLATGAIRWRATLPAQIRGGVAVRDGVVVASLLDGVVLTLDAETGSPRWRDELAPGVSHEASALFAPPTIDGDDLYVGHQRALAALSARSGTMQWLVDPVPSGRYGQSAAAVAVRDGLAVGTFEREAGGVMAWSTATGQRVWQYLDTTTVAVNASPVIGRDLVYIVDGADEVTALDLDGHPRWTVKLDIEGFDWGNATIGTPALAGHTLLVPTLYRDLVALDAQTGVELWRFTAAPGPLRTTHYRGGQQAGFAASPVVTGDVVWAVDTAGTLSALELGSGRLLWQTALDVPVLAGLAVSGETLVVASYDGTLRALVPTDAPRPVTAPMSCSAAPADAGCCDSGQTPAGAAVLSVLVGVLLMARGVLNRGPCSSRTSPVTRKRRRASPR